MFLPGKEVDDTDKEQIGDRVKALRNNEKMTVAAFARKLDCSQNQIYNIENGKTFPSNHFIKKISDRFFVSYQWLLTGKKNENEAEQAALKKINDYLQEDSVARDVILEAMDMNRSIWLKMDRMIQEEKRK